MDRRTWIAMVLCFGIFFGWQKFYIEPRIPHSVESPSAPAAALDSRSAPVAPSENAQLTPSPTQSPEIPAQTIPFSVSETAPLGSIVLSNSSPFFQDWALPHYTQKIEADSAKVDLETVLLKKGALDFAFEDPALSYLASVRGNLSVEKNQAIWRYEDSQVRLVRTLSPSADQGPYLVHEFTAEFKQKKPQYLFQSIAQQSLQGDPEAQDRQLLYFTDKSLHRIHLKDSVQSSVEKQDVLGAVAFIGAQNRYFLFALVDDSGAAPKAQILPVSANQARASLVYPIAEQKISVRQKVFFGPKELGLLKKVDPRLDSAVDLGSFLQFFAYPILLALQFLYGFVKNYGIAIILLTLFIKLVTFPLNYKSMKSMKHMAKLQPELTALRERYKDDKEALNREMMTFMRQNGYNPLSGCLPMLIQMPIFFALYRVLYTSIELFHAPFGFWIRDLSAKDPFYVTPLLLTVTMYFQQKMTPQTVTDPMQQKMMQFMPVIFGLMMINLPSGLTVYMLTNVIASIAQQIILNKKLDAPGVAVVPAKT